jgi:hypothetical protein
MRRAKLPRLWIELKFGSGRSSRALLTLARNPSQPLVRLPQIRVHLLRDVGRREDELAQSQPFVFFLVRALVTARADGLHKPETDGRRLENSFQLSPASP